MLFGHKIEIQCIRLREFFHFNRRGNLSESHTWFLMDLKDKIVIGNMLFMNGCEQ